MPSSKKLGPSMAQNRNLKGLVRELRETTRTLQERITFLGQEKERLEGALGAARLECSHDGRYPLCGQCVKNRIADAKVAAIPIERSAERLEIVAYLQIETEKLFGRMDDPIGAMAMRRAWKAIQNEYHTPARLSALSDAELAEIARRQR